MKYPVDIVIFDFDGVIIDSGKDIAHAVQHTLQLFKRPILSKEEIISYVGHGSGQLIRRSFKDCSEEIINQAIPIFRQYYFENPMIESKLYADVKETLEYMDKNMQKKMAIVTNKPEPITRRIIDKLDIKHYFSMLVGPESVKNMKPDPEGIIKVLKTLEIEPEKAIMIGDTYTDIEAGQQAGTFTCGVTYGLGSTEKLLATSPDFSINNMAALLDYIK